VPRLAADFRVVARNRGLAAVDVPAGSERDGLRVAQLVRPLATCLALVRFARAVRRFGCGLLGMIRLWYTPWKASQFTHEFSLVFPDVLTGGALNG
jgi:hypothetical protein